MLMLRIGKENGFTLIEIMIAVTLLAILIAVNLPDFENFLNSIERRGQLLQVEHLFKAVREVSISQKKVVEVFISNTGISYTKDNGESIYYKEDIVSRTVDRVSFYPDGTSSGASFTLKFRGGKSYTAVIDTISGKLKWNEWRE